MDLIPIYTTESDVKDTATFIIKRELSSKFKKTKKWIVYLAIISILLTGLLILVDSEIFAIPLAIIAYLLLFSWLFIIIWSIVYFIIKRKRYRWRNSLIEKALYDKSPYHLKFDEEKIYFFTEKYTSEIKWQYWKYFTIYRHLIIIVTENNLYDYYSISHTDIGENNFNKLKDIIAKKLIPLPPI